MKKRKEKLQLEPVIEFVTDDKECVFCVPISSIMYTVRTHKTNHYSVKIKSREYLVEISKNTYERINEFLKEHSTNFINIVNEQDNK